jgi:mannitol-specific phosphotransferase system IIBC component
MANLTKVDFYYGAVLSHLFAKNEEYKISLIERQNDQRVFLIETNQAQYVLRTHKCEGKQNVKEDAFSWNFTLSSKAVQCLQDNYENERINVVALVLLELENLSDSKIIYFTDKHLEAKGVYEKPAKPIGMTIRKYSNKNDYLLFIDKKIENAKPVKTSLNLKSLRKP